jgi:hypothetical protein
MPKRSIARLGATDAGVSPGKYPLGSPQSRAAARAMLTRRWERRERVDFVVRHIGAVPGFTKPQVSDWVECDDGTLMRCSHLPAGMTIEQAERIAADGRASKGTNWMEDGED